MKTTLGIDLGTQSIKVLFYDFENKKTVFTASSELAIDQDQTGKAEQNADWWISALLDALSKTPKDIKKSVVAISVSGQQHGFVALDKDGQVLLPVKLWCDTSTELECHQIMEELGGEQACIELSGNKIITGYTASKVVHLKNNHPDVYQQLKTILLPHDYLNFWLSGELCMEHGDASGTGFLNIKERCWSDEILQAMDQHRDLKQCLPELKHHDEFIGTLHSQASQSTGLPLGTPIAVGGGDNMMGAIGTANTAPGTITMSLGTSGTVFAHSDTPIIDIKGNISAFCSSNGGWLPLLCTMNCTVTSELLRNLLNADLDQFEELISQSSIGSEGVMTLPFFNGERTPNLPNAKGCILGLDASNMRQENILRSGIEGASFALKFGLEELKSLGVISHKIILTGGGANSPTWRQMIADMMGLEVVMLKNNEGAAFGAALQALATLENIEYDSEQISQHHQIDESLSCKPDPSNFQTYTVIYQQYLSAVELMSSYYDQ